MGCGTQSLIALVLVLCAGLWSPGCKTRDSASTPNVTAPDRNIVGPDRHIVRIDAPRELVTRAGEYIVTWRPAGEGDTARQIPINEHFDVIVHVAENNDARTPVTGANVTLTCFMPDHGHGMLREPKAQEIGGGDYLVRPLLLHMDGFWTIDINVIQDGLAAAADDELNL